MEERKPLVSVIVPVYNVYPYLRDCVQSVQAQSYQNWELLLVDDGSTDGSGELCDELAVEDGRIQVFHKPNGGQSDARNVGLQQTQGKYFYLLDSDDLIRSTALAQFVEHCEADGADAALTPLEMFSTEQPEGRTENPHQIPELLNREETMRRMLLHQGIGHGAGGVFFRREVWGDLQFPVGILYEDYAVMYRAIARCAKVEVFPEPIRLPHPYRFDHEERHCREESGHSGCGRGRDLLYCGNGPCAESGSGVPAAGYIPEDTERDSGWRLWQLSGGSGTDLPLCAGTPGACPAALGQKSRPDQGRNTSDQQAAVLCRLWAGRMEK